MELVNQVIINERFRWLEGIDPQKALFKGESYNLIKRFLDVLLIMIFLPIWAPIMLVIIIILKISDPHDPVLFRQWRTGKGGHRFLFYKFRTMIPNAEGLKEKYEYLNELNWPDFKIKDDPRVTRLGKILRKFSLDELPQLFNVLIGDMSLVGPRPTSIHPDNFHLWQTKRLDVIPGITGIWQLEGRARTLFDNRIRLDILYVHRRCLLLDIKILFRTIGCVIWHKGSF